MQHICQIRGNLTKKQGRFHFLLPFNHRDLSVKLTKNNMSASSKTSRLVEKHFLIINQTLKNV